MHGSGAQRLNLRDDNTIHYVSHGRLSPPHVTYTFLSLRTHAVGEAICGFSPLCVGLR